MSCSIWTGSVLSTAADGSLLLASGQQGQATTDDAVEFASRRPRTDVELLGEGASARLVLASLPRCGHR